MTQEMSFKTAFKGIYWGWRSNFRRNCIPNSRSRAAEWSTAKDSFSRYCCWSDDRRRRVGWWIWRWRARYLGRRRWRRQAFVNNGGQLESNAAVDR